VTAEHNLQVARDLALIALPYCVCLACKGDAGLKKVACGECAVSGWMNKAGYDNYIARHKKK
jgi:hypothetical protein